MKGRHMRIGALVLALIAAGSAAGPLWASAPGEDLIATYQRQGAGPFQAAAGGRAWAQEQSPPGADGSRSCVTCHGSDLTRPGRHVTTGKAIEPMALSVTPKRLTDRAHAEKWFGRNCRWTLGRDCSPQEKGDFVRLIQSR